MSDEGRKIYRFEDFRLDAGRGVLFRGDSVVTLTPKAVEILCLLVKNAGQPVTKEEIFENVWPDSFVEEANLSHHIFKLRKALELDGDRKLIETLPKRGYRFVGDLKTDAEKAAPEKSGLRNRTWTLAVIGLAGLLALIAAVWFVYPRQTPVEPEVTTARSSVAVMPFVNESGSEEFDYLSDGMTETLINSLSAIPSLSVKSRPSVFKYKGGNASATTIASDLNVNALLFGRLTVRGSDLNLSLSLIDPATENQIRGKQYARKLSDLVGLQDEIGRDVAQWLEFRITDATAAGLGKNYSKKGEAYRLYLLGDYHWAKFTEENFLRAKKYYEDAIAIDPNYALAYTGVANTYTVLAVNGHLPSADARPKAKAAAERSLTLDPNLAEAYVALGAHRMFLEWDLDAAEKDFRRAMQLDADYAVPHELMSYALRARGRHEEALAEAKRANELDPLNLLMVGDIGVCYRFAGQTDLAIEANRRLLEMDPNFGDGRFENALLLAQVGRYEDAMQEVTTALALTGNSPKVKSGVGIVYARMGNSSAARKVVDEILSESKENYVSPFDIALIFSAMNEKDKAFEWLEKAYRERTPWLFELNVTPELAPIRDDPRFTSLSNRIGLTN